MTDAPDADEGEDDAPGEDRGADDAPDEDRGADDERADGRWHGGDPDLVRRALAEDDPLPGTCGFAGRLDGGLVRDVLGRYPLFVDAEASGSLAPEAWSFDPTDLANPTAVPAGCRVTAEGHEPVWTLPDPDPVPAEDDDPAGADDADGDERSTRRAIEGIREAVRASVDAVPSTDLAIAFSGGLDSAILAARLDAPLYVVGFPGSHDVEAATAAADALGADLTVVELSHAALEAAVPQVAGATGRTNAMDVQIALGLHLAAERAAADGHRRLAVGQGADELFGGYAKVARAPEDPRVAADTVRGARREVVESLPDQLERDVLAVRAAGVEPVAPLLCDRVVRAALPLPGALLVGADGRRKVALREAARPWLPGSIVERDKKAVQYGSLIARELDRLARQAGYKRRMDDHVTKYVRSLVE